MKKRSKAQTINKAIKQEQALKFHSEASLSGSEINGPVTEFFNWVETLIPTDSYTTFVNLFQYPTPIVELTEKIYEELERVFDGHNPTRDYHFSDSKDKEDWSAYVEDELGGASIWRTEGWDQVKTSINSILIVDLPDAPGPDAPEPYFYWLDISKVIDYEMAGNEISWIIFEQKDGLVAIFDAEFYRVVSVNSKNEIEEVWVENPHDLGYCPAAFFWTDYISSKERDLKKAPLTPQLGNLNWLLFFMISKKHLELYGAYPIYSGYEQECDFDDPDTGFYCDRGFLRGADEKYQMLRDGTVTKCPACSEKKLRGPGAFIEIPVPTKDGPDLSNALQITTIDKASLEYNTAEEDRLTKKVYSSVVGAGGVSESREALNEKQVLSNYDAKKSVLNNMKGNIEAAEKFVYDTICRLRYGSSFLNSHINLGTEFYIASVSDLYLKYNMAKSNGASLTELDDIMDQIILTEHKTDPKKIQRAMTLRQLEPYRHNTRDELLELYKEKLIDRSAMILKINFNNFIDRFERENVSILDFGSSLAFDTKINIITKKLNDYVQEFSDRRADDPRPEGSGSGNEEPGSSSGGS